MSAEVPEGGEWNDEIVIGRGFQRTFCAREADTTTVIPLTGYSASAELRDRPGGKLLATFSTSVDEDLGEATITVAGSVTENLTPGVAFYDVKLTNGAAVVNFISPSKISIKQRVTA